ncbi:hypothetical protein B9479_005073 [Cryptococcus floricola]|uniref:SH3 domain-containing protein n=1 Tax=Cryptococcus floricola TaxID=2591691 RepID=A0A5D3AUK0_9TREE|nr:hypothetical protein B9479_005073 [Cryptococcus floricola]
MSQTPAQEQQSSPRKASAPSSPAKLAPSDIRSGTDDPLSQSPSTDPNLLSTRPAPISPASSRPSSAVFSQSSSAPPSRNSSPAGAGRTRSGSSASIASRTKRASSIKRKSFLANVTLPDDGLSGRDESEGVPTTIPEHDQVQVDGTGAHLAPDSSEHLGEKADDEKPVKAQQSPKTPVLPYIVRDYAYNVSDDRHRGIHEEEAWGSPHEQDTAWGQARAAPEDEDEDTQHAGGWGSFGGFLGWRRRFGSGQERDDQQEEADEVETVDVGAGQNPGEEYYTTPPLSEADLGYSYNVLPPLDPSVEPTGLHRVAYTFDGMGASEMSVDEGDLLYLSGRGNGNPGWVIARRMHVEHGKVEKGDAVGLVPESYLERVEVYDVEE